ncbi:FKBP-type peptidyl-prolyl cis-trans isomerase FkpA/FKBP-type peptidyl-prolyl cis-trans isomerase FklB [Mariprofundus ferrinatatus]|uniref:Peptidyl-prolyl cis-trans isomerase n=1 Tax=Mariprofundus ferrinatatus TaxID=1921087 RepID=A0A2K8L560_9PROT|nr:FKBP-type peptidyl-prolyl cis-trans isomerase [Mariprofundus ferrinatatus]ATX81379.1 FKBP-type peptidyl-prolyl cis-trans isomerase FkpA/FKBP-type peptidyl-prolyl cis-trans isomerase FklB [Mariprofundus ferrinatatus]
MKKIIALACLAMLAACGQQAEDKKATSVNLDSENARLSYAIGMDIGMSLKTLDTNLDRAVMIAAINDRLDGVDTKLSQEEAGKVKQEFFVKQAQIKEAERKAAGEKNAAEGAAFLTEHAKKEGVTVTESGLHYQVIREADGAKPTLEDSVRVHYKGTLIDGTEFDSSYSRGEPISFPLGGVIAGWQEGVQLMNVGSKYRFVLPSELAYGERGAGNTIGPNSVLIFEVELLAIVDEKAEAEAAAAAAEATQKTAEAAQEAAKQ